LKKDHSFFNAGTSYRRPNLYEVHGDSYVDANLNLLPEEAVGYELGFGVLSVFMYEFEEAIEYQPGYSEDVVTPGVDEDGNATSTTTTVYTNARYLNTGAYSTKGFRYSQMFGAFSIMLKATDTEQARVPKYVAVLGYNQDFGSHNVNATYSGAYDRKPGAYDGDKLEDLEKLNFGYVKTFDSNVQLALNVNNVLDEDTEVLPGYGTQGREFKLTIQRKW
jgi:outer membrane cobalamin receptor